MAVALQKTYTYQVYSAAGVYLGSLDNVVSEFTYPCDINTAGSQLQIKIQNSFDDVGASQSSDYWVDQSTNRITDEVGNRIVFATSFNYANIPIAVGNRIKVLASYDTNATGKTVFDGQISYWETSYKDQTINLTVLSWGFQLDNFLITATPTGQTIDQESYNTSYGASPQILKDGPTTSVAQSFNIASATTISSIVLFCSGSPSFVSGGPDHETITPVSVLIWSLYSGTPSTPGALIDGGTVNYTGSAVQQVTLQLSQAQSLSGNYFIQIDNGSGGSWYYGLVTVYASTANPYAGGSVYTGSTTAGTTTWTQVAGDDLAFIVQSSSGSNQLTFTNQDPARLLTNILDQAAAQGSIVDYSTTSIDNANTNVSYSYKVQTILEGIQKILQLAPPGWYWYVDPATNLLHFHRTPNTVNHVLSMGNEIKDLKIRHTLEGVINSVYFTGGATSGVNLYTSQTDAASVAAYGQRLERISDNRITDLPSAGIIMSNELGNKASPTFNATIEVLENAYDIELFDVGETVGLRGFGNFIDNLTFQIVRIERHPDWVGLTLGTLLPRNSGEFDSIRRRLDKLETVDNPAAPS